MKSQKYNNDINVSCNDKQKSNGMVISYRGKKSTIY